MNKVFKKNVFQKKITGELERVANDASYKKKALPPTGKKWMKQQKNASQALLFTQRLIDSMKHRNVHPYIVEGLRLDFATAREHVLKAEKNIKKGRYEAASRDLVKAKKLQNYFDIITTKIVKSTK